MKYKYNPFTNNSLVKFKTNSKHKGNLYKTNI